MRAKLQYIVQDPSARPSGADGEETGAPLVEAKGYDREDFFLPGPVTRRAAVVDLDLDGTVAAGAPFEAPSGNRPGRYRLAEPLDPLARDFHQVSVLATVLDTIYMFEEPDVLGRPVRWAFDGPQLLVVPRAGIAANAFYDRDLRSLLFYAFPSRSPLHDGRVVYTSLSHDVVAHETAHAVLDGIAPDLYHALTPQSLALHEAIADIAALCLSFRCRKLVLSVLEQTGGSIADATAFSWIAEEFGAARDRSGRAGYLRSLANDKTLDPADHSVDDLGRPNRVRRTKPHELSQVLSGALFGLMLDIFERVSAREQERTGKSAFSVSGRALFIAAERFKRLALRGLDYLPPGEVTFGDYARALLASDAASYADQGEERDWLAAELVRRHVVPSHAALEVRCDFEHPAVADADLRALHESDWAAYVFADRNRDLLAIPNGAHLRVRPRIDCTKLYFRAGGVREQVRELIFKVSWDREEANGAIPGLPARRQIEAGTTLAIDWHSRRVRALVPSEAALAPETSAETDAAPSAETSGAADPATTPIPAEERSLFLAELAAAGLLHPVGEAREAGPGLSYEVSGDLMRLRGAARLLHIVGAAGDEGAGADTGSGADEETTVSSSPPAGVDAGTFYDLLRRLHPDAGP